jgi:hypothetical protein
MAKKPSLTKTVASAAFNQAWFAEIPVPDQDPEVYQRTYQRYLGRFERLPVVALKAIARVASAEATRSIEAYSKVAGSLPPNVKVPIELLPDPGALAELVARHKAKSR